LNNAIKHARASEIYFRLKMQPSGFSFVIQDDGRGFVPGAVEPPAADSGRVSSGHGQRNLVHRLEKIGGVCTVRSEPGKGTEVELTVVIQSDGHLLRGGDNKICPAQN